VPQRYYLTVSTFEGIVPGARHYYGRIRWTEGLSDRKEHDVGSEGTYGSIRYLKKDYLLKAARRWFRKVAVKGAIMTIGSDSVIDPQQVVEAEASFKRQANYIWRQFEKLQGWDAPKEKWPEVQKLCDEWSALVFDYLYPELGGQRAKKR
jgi:hypothetical protein